jgi:phospholipase C
VSQLGASICPEFTSTGAYPASCANFDQLGFRVPFIAVSPFSRRHHVSHRVADHTSLLALIEKRFLSLDEDDEERSHLTARDLHAATLEDMFDFTEAPSRNARVPAAPLPLPNDPIPSPIEAVWRTTRKGDQGLQRRVNSVLPKCSQEVTLMERQTRRRPPAVRRPHRRRL